MGAEGTTVTVVEDFARHSPRLAELEAKLLNTKAGALGDNLAHVDADTRKRYAPQQGSEDGTTTATSGSLCWARALEKSRWATSGGGGSLQDEEEKLRTKWVSRAVGILRTAGVPAVAGAVGSEAPERALSSSMGRARPGTIQTRVRAWAAMSRWLGWRYGHVWPCVASGSHRNHRVHP